MLRCALIEVNLDYTNISTACESDYKVNALGESEIILIQTQAWI